MTVLYEQLPDTSKALIDALEIIHKQGAEANKEDCIKTINKEIAETEQLLQAAGDEAHKYDTLLDYRNRLTDAKKSLQTYFS